MSQMKHYKFIISDENVKLKTLFCNVISLGQFELARAILQQIGKIQIDAASILLERFLRDLQTEPVKHWVNLSGNIPTLSHVVSFFKNEPCMINRAKSYEEDAKETEIEILLYNASHYTGDFTSLEQLCTELSTYYMNTARGIQHPLNWKNLESIFLACVPLSCYLYEYLGKLGDKRIDVAYLNAVCQVLVSDAEAGLDLVKYIKFSDLEMQRVESLFMLLESVNKRKVYTSLLCCEGMEYLQRWEALQGHKNVLQQPDVWNSLYHHLASNPNVHFLEHIMDAYLSTLDNPQLPLPPSQFATLVPLFLILAWDRKPEHLVTYKRSFFNLQHIPDSNIRNMWDHLLYRMKRIWWCWDQIHEIGNGSLPQDIPLHQESLSSLYHTLSKHSLLYTMYRYIPRISKEQWMKILAQNPDRGSGSEESVDRMILEAYFALNEILAVYAESGHLNIAELQGSLMKIESPDHRLLILGIIFTTLFLTSNDLKMNPGKETFVANVTLVQQILQLLKDVLKVESSDKLERSIADAEWRLDTVTAIGNDHAAYQHLIEGMLINTMLASPSTLLAMAIKSNHYEKAKQISQQFSLDPKLPTLAAQVAAMETMVTEDAKSKLEEALLQMTTPDAFLTCADFAITAPVTLCKYFLGKVSSYFTELEYPVSGQKHSAHGKIFAGFLHRLSNQITPSLALEAILPRVEFLHVQDSDALAHIKRTSLLDAHNSLHAYFEQAQGHITATHSPDSLVSEISLKEIADHLNIDAQNNQQAISKDSDSYLATFLKHIVLVTELLHSKPNRSARSTLEESPTAVMKSLIFEEHDYLTAEKLGKPLNIDVIDILLTHCFGSKVTSEMVDYVGKHEQLLASLLAVIATQKTVGEFNTSLMRYAQSNTKTLPTHYLYNWVNLKGFAYTVFCASLLHQPLSTLTTGSALCPYFGPETVVSESPSESLSFGPKDQKYFELIHRDDLKGEQEFYAKVVQNMMEAGKWKEALSILDNTDTPINLAIFDQHLPKEYPEDHFLTSIVNANQDSADVWKYIVRMHSKEKAAAFIVNWLHKWDVNVCVDLLYMCKVHLSRKPNLYAGMRNIDMLYSQMKTYQDILKVDPRWKGWQKITDVCKNDPAVVVRRLLELHEHNLARKICELFKVPQMSNEIEESYLYYLFTNNDANTGLQVLASLEDSILVATNLLGKISDNATKLLLVQYLSQSQSQSPSQSNQSSLWDSLHAKELSLQILIRLPPNLQHTYDTIMDFPELIIECLLMCELTTELQQILGEISKLRNDDLVIKYVRKAMAIPAKGSNERSVKDSFLESDLSGEARDPKSLIREKGAEYFIVPQRSAPRHWMLTGDHAADDGIRAEHLYPLTPNINLAKALLQSCFDPQKAGQTCVNICAELSQLLLSSNGPRGDNLVLITIIRELLKYAKIQFLKTDNGGKDNEGVTMCDTFLSHLELLQSLLISRCLPTGFSFSDFGTPSKARQLRDNLIAQDRMKLALNVATKCNIDAHPVWAAWGMSLLKMGKFAEAKEKFSNCLVYQPNADETPSLVDDIVSALECTPCPDPATLRQLHSQLSATLRSAKAVNSYSIHRNCVHAFLFLHQLLADEMSIESYLHALHISTPSLSSERKTDGSIGCLDSVRLMQCVYYLKRYGTTPSLIQFWVRHHLLEDACRFIFSERISSSIFIKEVVQHCVSHKLVPQLMRTLTTIDPSLEKFKDYLQDVCKNFNQKKMYHLLLDFLVFMKDEIRAGLTCIKLFLKQEDYNSQVKYLEAAKHYFTQGQSTSPLIRSNEESVISEAEITKYQRTLSLQLSATKFFHVSQLSTKQTNTPLVSLFGPPNHKAELAEQLLVLYNFDLGFEVIQEFRLPITPIYVNAVGKIARKKQANKVTELLRNIKGTINDEEWDEVLMACIHAFVEVQDLKTAEKFVAKLASEDNKLAALVACQKLKAAYLSAVKTNNVKAIQLICEEAKKINDTRMFELCQKYLQQAEH